MFKKFLRKKIKIDNLSDSDLEFLLKKFNKEIREYYIKQELPMFGVSRKDKRVRESLSELYQSEDYKIFIRLICNYKNRLGSKLMKVDSTEIHRKQDDNGNTVNISKFSDSYWRGFFDGQAKFISFMLALVKSSHMKQMKQMKEEEKNKKGE